MSITMVFPVPAIQTFNDSLLLKNIIPESNDPDLVQHSRKTTQQKVDCSTKNLLQLVRAVHNLPTSPKM